MKKLMLIWACCLLLGLPQAEAGTVRDLYKMEVPVSDREASTRASGLVAALRQVVVRVTGDRTAAQAEGMQSLYRQAQRYVQQYGYNRIPAEPPADEALSLWVQFDQNLLEREIRDLGLPVWGSTRPSALAWIVASVDGQTGFVAEDTALGQILQNEFKRRGIPLIFPRLDAEDRARLNTSDVLQGHTQLITEASRRYGAEALLAGRLQQTAGGFWEADWHLQIDLTDRQWSSQGDVPELVIEEGVDGVADSLAAEFAAASLSGKSGWQLLVDNITSVDDYARVQSYLASLDAVTRVEVRQMDTRTATFYVEAHGGAQAVSQTIALGHTLQPVTPQRFLLLPRVIEH